MRPALEAAIAVARAGQLEDPPVASPTRLLPYLEFSRYPAAALDVARRVLDEDEEFRLRVADHVDLHQLGEAAELFLRRPDGWDSALAELEASASTQAASQFAERQERRATKQLQITKEALEAARAHAYAEAAQAGKLRDELVDEHRARQALEHRVGELEGSLARARDERTNAVRELKAMEQRMVERTGELREALERLGRVEQELADALALADERRNRDVEPSARSAVAAPEPPAHGESTFDRDAVATAIAEASLAASRLASALERAAGGLALPSSAGEGEAVRAAPTGVVRPVRRRPVPLPLGVFDDSVEAVDALLAVDQMLLLVDGYNVTLLGWPDLTLTLQRERLIDALAALQARTGADSVVVFDGAEAGRDLPPASRLRGVQVRFTEPDVEADDVIISSVARLPADRPVTVVSSDNRVRAGAMRSGANVISSQQLLDVVRR